MSRNTASAAADDNAREQDTAASRSSFSLPKRRPGITFLCHTDTNKDLVAAVNRLLLLRFQDGRGETRFFGRYDIPPGGELSHTIYEAIANTSTAVIFCSHAFFKKKLPQAELDMFLERWDNAHAITIVPILVDMTDEAITRVKPRLTKFRYLHVKSTEPFVVQKVVDFVTGQRVGESVLHRTARDNYLRWLVSQTESIEVRGLRHSGGFGSTLLLELKRVYVGLKVDPTNLMERMAAREAFLQQVDQLALEANGDFTAEEMDEAVWKALANVPMAESFEAVNRIESITGKCFALLIIAQATQLNRALVILGDPGSGKTTIAR